MVVPSLDTEHPGIRVIAEVASVLQAGLASGEALQGVVGALRRGLTLRRCRIWLRTPDGTRFTPVTTPGDEAEQPGYAPPVAEWMRRGPQREGVPGGSIVRLPLVHEDEPLGVLEVVIPTGRYEGIAHDVVVVAARILAPMIAATELSQDLASEVALRTHEIEAQRSFAAQIIDSLPVGLYVIDRAYRIRAWNRKRETGTQGVSREDAVGREIFEVLDRQPRDLLKCEFDRVFDTGELQQVEMESQASGEARYYRITKIPMRQDGRDISHVITIGEDITERRQAQQRLTETEKLAAVQRARRGGWAAHRATAGARLPRPPDPEFHGADAQRDGCRGLARHADGAKPHQPRPCGRDPARVYRHGHRDQAGGFAQDLRAVLHDEAAGARHRTRSVHLLRDHRRASRADRRRVARRRGIEFQGVPPHGMKILVVEDDKTVGQYVKRGLTEAGFHADLVGDGAEGLRLSAGGHYDMLVLDLRLPALSGLEVVRTLRDRGEDVPVLVLTAQDAVDFKVQALKMGADDYVTKPFSLEELLARVEALGRRPKAIAPPVLKVADLTLDTGSREVGRGGKLLELTPKEYAVLEYLMRHH